MSKFIVVIDGGIRNGAHEHLGEHSVDMSVCDGLPLADDETHAFVRQLLEDRAIFAHEIETSLDFRLHAADDISLIGDPNFFEDEARRIREEYSLAHMDRLVAPVCFPVEKNYTHPRSPRESFRSQRGRRK